MSLFGFLEMADSYKERKVARHEEGDLFIDTCKVTDCPQPYETAVAHPAYNDGKMVIVAYYDTKEEAQEGHERWVQMKVKNPPDVLVDVSKADVVTWFQDTFRDDLGYPKPYERVDGKA